MVGKSVHTNIEQTTSGQTIYNLQHLLYSISAIAIFLFFNIVLEVHRAALIDLWQAFEYHFTE
jgi:hypothetical protein